MTDETRVTRSGTELTPVTKSAPIRNKSSQVTAIRRATAGSATYVPHLSVEEVRLMAGAVEKDGRHGDRNARLIEFLFDSCLRVSEALAVRPNDLDHDETGWFVQVMGKGSRPGKVAISASVVAKLQSYAYRQGIGWTDKLFPISRSQAFRIVTTAYEKAGIRRPGLATDRVGAVHILRHSGAIERLRLSGNPKAVQDHLRHVSAQTTLRYMKTLSAEESLKVQQAVEFQW